VVVPYGAENSRDDQGKVRPRQPKRRAIRHVMRKIKPLIALPISSKFRKYGFGAAVH
jgi:hypothetical protein